jgi:AcrR family transcriptional regulator
MTIGQKNAGRPSPRRPVSARRVPSQVRGQKRYEELLDAAEQVIADVGVDAATTNAIAERAGAGMGSLYRFFPNKEAIVEALAKRYIDAMRPLTAYEHRPEFRTLPLAAVVDEIVDPLVDFFRSAPAYRHVFHATDKPGSPGRCGCELADSVVKSVEVMMAERIPHTKPGQRRVHAMVAVELVHRLLDYAFDVPPSRRRAFINETKRLLALYAEMIGKGDDPLQRLR